MIRVFAVARREYLERVRSKAFLIGTLLGPILMLALTVLPSLVMARQRGKPLKLAVLDDSGSLKNAVEQTLARTRAEDRERFVVERVIRNRAEELKAAVVAGQLDGYVHLPVDTIETSVAEYYGRNVSNVLDLRLLENALTDAVVSQRLVGAGFAPEKITSVKKQIDLKTIRVSERGERLDKGASFFFSMLLLMLLYMSVIMWGQSVMTGVIEEKTTRIVEVMVSSISSNTLLSGKLLGLGAAGLTQLLVWVISLVAVVGLGANSSWVQGMSLPEISPLVVGSFPVFFLLGYFLYSSFYAAIGAAVNSTQEAHSLVLFALSPLIACMMFFPAILQSPDGTLSTVLSLIPVFTPLIMFLRISALAPPAWQIALSITLTLLTILVVNWVAARIYRVGILMYGKRPTFPEIVRWVGTR